MLLGWLIHSRGESVGNPPVTSSRRRRGAAQPACVDVIDPRQLLTSLVLLLLACFDYCVSNAGLLDKLANNLQILIKFFTKVTALGPNFAALWLALLLCLKFQSGDRLSWLMFP